MTKQKPALDRNKLKDKTFGSLFGIFIGDALGLPVETMGPIEIRHSFGYVDFYIRNKDHKWPGIAKRSPGTISDDSQLSLAIMDSLQRSQGYSITDLALSHVEAMDGKWGTPVGWGKSTRESVKRIKSKIFPSAEKLGAGNGTCMKISPLSIYCVYKTMNTSYGRFTNSFNASLFKKCREITELTHGNPMCIVAAYCQARMVIRGMQDEIPKTSRAISNLFIEDAEYAENKVISTEWHDEKRLSNRLKEILFGVDQVISPLTLTTPYVSQIICQEKSSFVYNSYPLVAYCISKYLPYRNFRHAILETINAGADADSNGSMVGAIIGATLGFHAIPPDLVKGLKNYKKLLVCSRNFEQNL